MPPAFDVEGRGAVHLRAGVAVFDGEFGEGGGNIERGQGRRGFGDQFGLRHHFLHQIGEELQFQRQRFSGGLGDFLLKIGKFGGCEARGVRHRLAVDESLFISVELVGVRGRGLDVIAEDVVVLDLEAGDAGFLRVFRLQSCDMAAAVVAELHEFVELRRIAAGDKAAVARQHGQIGGEGALELVDQRMVRAPQGERLKRGFEALRQVVRVDEFVQLHGLRQGVADGGKVARAAALEAEAGDGALDVGAVL